MRPWKIGKCFIWCTSYPVSLHLGSIFRELFEPPHSKSHCSRRNNSVKCTEGHTYSLVKCTPPLRPLSNTPLPLPPARIWALSTISLASERQREIDWERQKGGKKDRDKEIEHLRYMLSTLDTLLNLPLIYLIDEMKDRRKEEWGGYVK